MTLMLIFVLIGCDAFSNTHTVNFVLDNELEDVAVKVEDGKTIQPIILPEESNHLILGWYTSSDFETKFDFNEPINEDIDLYVKYSHFEFGKENFITYQENN